MKTIRDAVYGDMRFDRLESAVVDTPALQRLRGVKQLGMSCLVYPSANHTRFEHSLGTCWVAKKMLDALVRQGHSLSVDDRTTVCLAALLHDVTHVPFGHTFEDERRLFPRHDEDGDRLHRMLNEPTLRALLSASGVGGRVVELLEGKTSGPPFVRQLVTGTVCADLLDY
ncbi:MAG: HD domain-containing protein, partial [Planctomycetia bacterium]